MYEVSARVHVIPIAGKGKPSFGSKLEWFRVLCFFVYSECFCLGGSLLGHQRIHSYMYYNDLNLTALSPFSLPPRKTE